jgi:hypothetical protein
MVSFSDTPGTISTPSVSIISNQRISEGTTYQFTFTSSLDHVGKSTLRFTFPEGYNTESAMCDITGLYGGNPETEVFHNSRIIACVNANKDILSSE